MKSSDILKVRIKIANADLEGAIERLRIEVKGEQEKEDKLIYFQGRLSQIKSQPDQRDVVYQRASVSLSILNFITNDIDTEPDEHPLEKPIDKTVPVPNQKNSSLLKVIRFLIFLIIVIALGYFLLEFIRVNF